MLLLHLSDIHFRAGEIGTAMDPNSSLRNELLRDASEMCSRLGAAPDAVLVTGDLAFGGAPEEYQFALEWLELLCRACGASLSSVFTVPGNHDVVRKVAARRLIQAVHRDIKAASDVTLDGVIRGLLQDEETGRLLYEALGPYNAFAAQFFCDLLPPERTIARRDLKLNDGSVLRLSGFNSAFVSSSADRPGDLFVDPACFQLQRERGVEHLVLCHHPYAWLRQGDALRDFLGDVARLHLFGHEHTNRIELNRDWVRIAASAAHPDREEPGWEPGYNFISLRVEGTPTSRKLEVGAHVRVWQTRPGQFRAKLDRDSDVFTQTIRLDAWASPVTSAAAPSPQNTDSVPTPAVVTTKADPMESIREISVRFFKLTVSQRAAIAGKLNLLEQADANQPDFERFRRVLLRAIERGVVEELDREVQAVRR